MPKVGLIVPVYKNFTGFAELMHSVDHPVEPIIIPNWKENLGVSAGWNDGLYLARKKRCDVAVIVNDDVVLGSETIYNLMAAVWNLEYDLATAVNTRDTEVHEGVALDDPDFACFAVQPAKFIHSFGYFDEEFTPAYFEDNDMHYRLKLAKARVARLNYAGMYHAGSVTQNWGGQQVVSGPMFERNREYYARKWGGYPGQETFTKPFGAQ